MSTGGHDKEQGGKRTKGVRKDSPHTTSYVQILGNGTDTGDTCPTVLLFFDQQRFVFNVGEGFQRYCFQHKIKLGKVTDLFFTRMSTEACGGVPGLILTMTEHGIGGLCSGSAGLTLHGPLNVQPFLDAVGTFVALDESKTVESSFGVRGQHGLLLEPLVSNERVQISPVVILPDRPPGNENPRQSDSEDSTRTRKKSKVDHVGEPGTDGHGNDSGAVPASCYVCELAESKGRFHPERAKALGIQPGPLYAKLQRGESVTTDQGVTVHPGQVMDASIPGPAVLIIDCPDESYLKPLVNSKGLNEWLDEASQNVVVIHMSSAEVVSSEPYVQWIAKFPISAKHILVNLEACQSTAVLRKAAVVQTKLNCVDDRYFPLPAIAEGPVSKPNSIWHKEGIFMGQDLSKFWLKPHARIGFDASEVPEPFSASEVVDNMNKEFLSARMAIELYKEMLETDEVKSSVKEIASDELEVTFLGTGSAVPSKYRNVTCIYLDFFEKGSMFLDCGEGSLGQLVRRFGRVGAEQALRKLKCIWISHIHADHHVGLSRILSARQKLLGLNASKILIIGPPGLRKTVWSYSKLEHFDYAYLITNSIATMCQRGNPIAWDSKSKVGEKRSRPPQECLDMFDKVKKELELTAMDSFYVKHCSNAFGVSIESKTWKVVFSGDSMPCASMLKAAKGATLLIHEATFEEDMVDEAKKKKHSTTMDALSIAEKSGAYRTILTHFSQRYPKVPVLPAVEKRTAIGVAFDLMRLNLADLEALPKTVDPCMFLFDEEQAEAGESALI